MWELTGLIHRPRRSGRWTMVRMELSFRCTNVGCLAGILIVIFAALGLSAPFWVGAWAAIQMGLL